MLGSESPHNPFPCRLSALLHFHISFLCLGAVPQSLLWKGSSPVPRAPSCPGSLSGSPGPPYPRPDPQVGAVLPEPPPGPGHKWLVSPDCHISRSEAVTRRRQGGLLICDTLQLTAFLACTIFRPQTTPFFCVWKAWSSCWALGTNQPFVLGLQKLFSPKRTAIPVHLH